MLGPDLTDKVRPFSRCREADATAALAIGEAERGNDLRRRVLTHAVGERLQRLIEAAAVGLLAFGHGLGAAAPAGHADIKMWAGFERHVHPVRHCRRILGCKRHQEGTRDAPRLADRTGHRSYQGTPPGISDQASDGRSPGSRIVRLPPPSQGSPQWPITASFPPTVPAAAAEFGRKPITAFPFHSSSSRRPSIQPH